MRLKIKQFRRRWEAECIVRVLDWSGQLNWIPLGDEDRERDCWTVVNGLTCFHSLYQSGPGRGDAGSRVEAADVWSALADFICSTSHRVRLQQHVTPTFELYSDESVTKAFPLIGAWTIRIGRGLIFFVHVMWRYYTHFSASHNISNEHLRPLFLGLRLGRKITAATGIETLNSNMWQASV